MKQKYMLLKDNEKNVLIIKEYAELDKELFSLLCEEVYPDAVITEAAAGGEDTLIRVLRTENMYPPIVFARKIAATAADIYATENTQLVELVFDDIDYVAKLRERQKAEVEADDEKSEMDDMLDDSFEAEYEDKESLSNINSLQVAEDDILDVDDES